LRRVQAHVLEPGNFLDPHIDNGANPLWDISTICGFESASQGGTLVVEAEDGSKISYDGSAGTVVLFRANLRHEITRVISGQRRTLACWYSRSDAPNPARS
jgi:predicted 2-oxoglutarate/Fe(II)-dependent dioxygenase YbiX